MTTSEDIYNLLSDEKNGIVTKFTDETQLAPLRNVLIDVFNTKATKVNLNNNKTHNKKLLANDKEMIGFINKIDKTTGGIFKLTDKIASSGSGGLFGKMFGAARMMFYAGKTLVDAGMKYMEFTQQYYKHLKALSDAGVTITEGFDDAFATFAGMANLSQENFAKILISNSQFVARMNNVYGKSIKAGTELIGLMAEKLNGQYALDENATKNIITYFTSLTKTISRNRLLDGDNLPRQAEILGRNFKALSKAVGVSIEQFIEQNKQREQELAIKQIMSDPRRRDKFAAMQSLVGTDAALWMETGIANDKAIQLFANPIQAAVLQGLDTIYDKTKADKNGLTEAQLISFASQSNEVIKGLDTLRENFQTTNTGLLQLLNSGDGLASAMFGMIDVHGYDMDGLKSILFNNADKETSIVNNMTQLTQSVDVIKELMIHKFIPNADKAAAFYGAMSGGANAIRKMLYGKGYKKIVARTTFGMTDDEYNITKSDREGIKNSLKNDFWGFKGEEKVFRNGKFIGRYDDTVKDTIELAKKLRSKGIYNIKTINEKLDLLGGGGYRVMYDENKNIIFDKKTFLNYINDLHKNEKFKSGEAAMHMLDSIKKINEEEIQIQEKKRKEDEQKKKNKNNVVELGERSQQLLENINNTLGKGVQYQQEANDISKSDVAVKNISAFQEDGLAQPI